MPKAYKKILSLHIAVALLVLLVGYFMRIQHWQYSFEVNLFGLSSLGVLYITRFAEKKSKTLKDTSKVLMVVFWVVITTTGLFKLGFIPYLVYPSFIIGICWIILEFIDFLKPNTANRKLNPILRIGVVLMILFVLIKVLFWPFASIIFLISLLFSSIGFIVDHLQYGKGN